ncbi:pyruvate dehydrogenase (acetyl-transferring), homodimeric type [Acidiferrimicrobium sp. IK]|uniref:pyruvate dehydrogenase (acetyl-transferring), homodimeric type n=1 Tax=Acidiferrimicrobium sp. IK TaxID=2871700 RepID=UPI0021CB71E9|nr:pyruvate dehydrogenase (acetyl-transferring), homodimeric type [Acidiferrimicrobium sp. IK]MCU4184269.1 pyruvate dehydrogenase (acetyl-transferring), homodimeric type [Acidiferrimicrobium sp. IK]
MIFDGFSHQLPDIDPQETAEWLDSFDAVLDEHGKVRARYLLMKLLERATASQVGFPATVSTPYANTIPSDQEPWFPGDEDIERRIRAFIRWNAAIMVVRANHRAEGIGGHLATYASSASLYEVGFNHFFRGKADGQAGDQVFFQGHAAPGIYARAFLEGRLTTEQLDFFRQELGGRAVSGDGTPGPGGLSSYPHPRLMPEFWEFPTVSMGLGPLNGIYQARFNRYLHNRRIADTSRSRVWCFLGDGECDEPETLGALSIAAREQLDNLIFIVNCNLQRLDGPVRGNGKVIQELEAVFRGAGWNVIKVIWGSKWDELLARDVDGVLLNKMNTTVDGEFQKLATEDGAYIREHFFGPDPRLRRLVEHLSDDELRNLPRGGHDYRKLYAAYKAATETTGQPTAILAKTIKGWTLGPEIEARNSTHQIKKMNPTQLRLLRDRLHLNDEIPDSVLEAGEPPFFCPAEDSIEYQYMIERRAARGGSLPQRVVRAKPLAAPDDKVFAEFDSGSGTRHVSTTMAFAVLMRGLLRDKAIGQRVVPIIPDEARTFGMDGLFKEVKIYAPLGQLYDPVDSKLMLSYAEAKDGQILEEGISEAGAMADFTAAATAYATWGQPMIPFFIFYSMFGFQRVGDLIWACGDMRGRGFLLGGTAGRTTLLGEGLQHDDGHSLVLASTVPNLQAYDPAFAYETATIVKDGIRRMYGPEPEDVFYYLTLYNENYAMPAKPGDDHAAIDEGILRGAYRFAPAPEGPRRRATILFSGSASQAALAAQQMLAADHDVAAELWSVTSYKALREDALAVERWNRLHPSLQARTPYVTEALSDTQGPVVAVTDFMKSVPDQIARWVPAHFTPLGTDGYGMSDTREALRRHFETDAAHVVVAVIDGLRAAGDSKPEEVEDAIRRYGIDPESPDPAKV